MRTGLPPIRAHRLSQLPLCQFRLLLNCRESLSGKHVIIVDDVATSGGSIVKAAEIARAAGAVVDTALVIVDREEGGSEALAAAGIKLLSALKKSDFL